MSKERVSQVRHSVIVALVLAGLLLTLFSLAADWLGLDLTPGFGMIQMFQLLVGLSSLTLGSFIYLRQLRPEDAPRSLQADIGVRLAATGLFAVYAAGLSDLLGIGTHVVVNGFERPFVGPFQLAGIGVGLLLILGGLGLYHTSRGVRQHSSLEFIASNGEDSPSPTS